MVNNKNFAFIFFGVFILITLVLSLNLTSAVVSGITFSSNASNGSTWHKAGSNQSFNVSLVFTTSNNTNVTHINFTAGANITFWGNTLQTNKTAAGEIWTCIRTNASWVECNTTYGGTDDLAINITFNVTLNASATEINHTISILTRDNYSHTNTTLWNVATDGIAPKIITPYYAWWMNQTSIKNSTTSQLTFNISANDTSGASLSYCYANINGTNQTFTASTGWCNFTVGNLTGLADGNATLLLYMNDTTGNWRLNNSLVLQMDTVAPVVTHTCTPEPVTQGTTLACTCSSTDATSGVNSTGQVFTANPSTSDTGTYNSECIEFDYGGTSIRSLVSYNVVGGGSNGGSGGSGGSAAPVWTTQTITSEVFEKGYTAQLASNNRVRVQISGENHHVGIVSITTTKATIEIASDPVRITLAPGEDAKADVDGDGYYDIKVVLNSIVGNKADITITKIYEKISADEEGPVETTGEIEATPSAEEKSGSSWLWIVIVIVLVLVIGTAARRKK